MLLEAAIVNTTQLPTLKNGYSFDSQTRKGCHLMVELCTVVMSPDPTLSVSKILSAQTLNYSGLPE